METKKYLQKNRKNMSLSLKCSPISVLNYS